MRSVRPVARLLALLVAVSATAGAGPALAGFAAEINRDVNAAMARLQVSVPETRQLAAQAKAVLVFPTILKAGFLFGAQYGEGALRRQSKTVGFYGTVAASYGFQAGVQTFGYALFFMSDS